MINIDQFIEKLFADFTPKQKKVIFGRFGIKNGKRITLQEIGNELNITRERVRQIEEHAMKKLSKTVEEGIQDFLNTVTQYLSECGGVRKHDEFMEDLKQKFFSNSNVKNLEQKLTFLFHTAKQPLYHKENDATHDFWYVDEAAKKNFMDFVKKVTQFFKTTKREKILNEKAHLKEFPDFASYHFLSIPKHFGKNVFGDFGLKSWPEIEPKTIRDKAYLTLKKHGKPLHFQDIARYISQYGIDKRPAHIQTVHNELIKDGRFVLVGRGMYGLSEQGFEPGTVKEVIVRLLKKHGPLQADRVVSLVNQQRFLKHNTILLSLQNRRHFKKLDDGRYHVKEA